MDLHWHSSVCAHFFIMRKTPIETVNYLNVGRFCALWKTYYSIFFVTSLVSAALVMVVNFVSGAGYAVCGMRYAVGDGAQAASHWHI